LAGKKRLFSLDPNIESKFRERVELIYGSRKGALSHAVNQALVLWLEKNKNTETVRSEESDKTPKSSIEFPKRENVSFQAVFQQIGVVFALCKLARALSEDIILEIDQDGILMRTIDEHHIRLLHIRINPKDMKIFKFSDSFRCYLDLKQFVKCENLVSKHEAGEIYLEEEKKLVLLDSESQKLTFSLPDFSGESPPLPRVSLPCSFVTETDFLYNKLRSIKTAVGEYIVFSYDASGQLIFESDWDDIQYKYDIPSSHIKESKGKVGARATYSIDYLVSILEASHENFPLCKLDFDNEMPLRLSLAHHGLRNSLVDVYLAPRKQDK
jgi:hypothetical protein